MAWWRGAALAAALSLPACSGSPPAAHVEGDTQPVECLDPRPLAFTPDPGDADEAYVCFGFDAASVGVAALGGVLWNPPDAAGPTALHHATLYAVPADFPAGPATCDGMPSGAVGLHVWSPGGDDLELPSDTALEIPASTTTFVIEAHVRRSQPGEPGQASATLCGAPATVVHHAAFLGYSAPVPALRPMHEEETDGACELSAAAHLWSVWPHMHLAGQEITVRLRDTARAEQLLVAVDPWSFHQQRSYRISVDARAGDTLETHCRWQNATDSYILPGLRSQDEMCNTGLIIWPAEAAVCR